MTRRIQRLLSVPIKPAMMLAMAASTQTGMPEPSGFLRTEMGLVGPVRLGRTLITSPTNGRGTEGKTLSQCARVSRRSLWRDWHAFSASCIYDRHPTFGATSMRKGIAVNSAESGKMRRRYQSLVKSPRCL
jgi:hypothetical protein